MLQLSWVGLQEVLLPKSGGTHLYGILWYWSYLELQEVLICMLFYSGAGGASQFWWHSLILYGVP